jgi:hypothetical protein
MHQVLGRHPLAHEDRPEGKCRQSDERRIELVRNARGETNPLFRRRVGIDINHHRCIGHDRTRSIAGLGTWQDNDVLQTKYHPLDRTNAPTCIAATDLSRRRREPPRQALDIGGDVVGLRSCQRKIHLGVGPDQVEDERFGVEPVFSADRQERRRIGHDVVARIGGYDVAGGASLLREPLAALDVGGVPARSHQRETETAADGDSFHPRPPCRDPVRPHEANLSGMVPVHIDPGQTRFGGRNGRNRSIVTGRS